MIICVRRSRSGGDIGLELPKVRREKKMKKRTKKIIDWLCFGIGSVMFISGAILSQVG